MGLSNRTRLGPCVVRRRKLRGLSYIKAGVTGVVNLTHTASADRPKNFAGQVVPFRSSNRLMVICGADRSIPGY